MCNQRNGIGKLLILTGLPASGKTSVALCLSKIADVIIVSSDEVRKKRRRRVWDTMENMIREGLTKGKIMVVDATNYDRKHRDRFAYAARHLNCPYWIAYLKASTETLLERNAQRPDSIPRGAIYRHLKIYQAPAPEENAVIIDTESIMPRKAAEILAKKMKIHEASDSQDNHLIT